MRHKWTTRYAAQALCMFALITVSACTNETPPEEPEVPQPCTTADAVALTVASGLTPSISWSPNCTVAGLFVQRVSDGANMWTLSTTTSPLKSAVTYGTAPQFSTGSNASPLIDNVQYRAGLVTAQGVSIATKLFIP